MQPPSRILTVAYPDAEAFRAAYDGSLVHGGVFAATGESFELREQVGVRLVLDFCGQTVEVPGEVVHIVTPEMTALGAEPGVGLQLLGEMHEVRGRLETLARTCGVQQFKPTDPGRRAAPRVRAHVPARIECESEEPIDGHTRDISVTGMLVAVQGRTLPAGSYVSVTIDNPTTGDALELGGTVVREVETAGTTSALGIHFDPRRDQRAAVEGFIEAVQSAEAARRLGGISGSIPELGAQNLLQMFGKTSPSGTLTYRRGEEEGVIGFEKGLLRYARLGSTSGIKALARLLAWEDGTFEFHARLDAVELGEPPLPIDAAMFEAVRLIDELGRIDRDDLPAQARVRVADLTSLPSLSKLQQAVLDLAAAGFSVERMLEVIPEADAEVLQALQELRDEGAIRLET